MATHTEPERRAKGFRTWYESYGLSRTTAIKQIENGRLRALKVGKKLLVTAEAEAEWLASLPPARAKR
jgi:excisionase family DNA binding protein